MRRTLSIGIVTDCYTPTRNGVATSIVHLKEGLERRGHQVSLFTVGDPRVHQDDPGVIRYPSVPFDSALGLRLGVTASITAQVRRAGVDVIHTHTEFPLGWAARRAGLRLGIPLVHSIHTLYDSYRHYLPSGRMVTPGIVRAYLRRFLDGYDVIVCPSPKALRYVEAIVPDAPVRQINNPVSLRRFGPHRSTAQGGRDFRRKLGIRPSDQVVLFAGRLGIEKRVLEMLQSVETVLRTRPNARLLLVGGGPLRTSIEGLSLGSQFVTTGPIEWKQMPSVYAAADVFLTTSLSEMQPMTVIEAVASAVPVVARRDDAYAGLVEHGVNGFLETSDGSVAAAVAALLDDPSLRRRLSAGVNRVAARFAAHRVAAAWEILYNQMIQTTSTPNLLARATSRAPKPRSTTP